MRYDELKERIRDLGFADDETMREMMSVVINGINAAINTISSTVSPVIRAYVIEQDGNASGIKRYDMRELAEGFMDFYKQPKCEVGEELKLFTDYDIEAMSTVVLRGSFEGKVNFYYKKKPEAITRDTLDNFEIELPPHISELIPLLASYYIWLDDEESKAVQYYNMYENRRNEIVAAASEMNKIEVVGGIDL